MTSEIKHTLGFLVHTAGRLMRKRFEQRAVGQGLDMSTSQWRLLFWVAKEEGIAQARLAELLEIEPISVSRLVDRMEQNGWIERRADSSDRRVRSIFTTAKGREASAELMAVANSVSDEALAGLPEGTRRTLVEGLEALVENLSCGEADLMGDRDCAATVAGGSGKKILESAHS